MPMSKQGSQSGEPLTWKVLSDFTPGIFDVSYIAQSNTIIPAPFGSCVPANTYACAGLPQGGLAPLPGVKTAYQYSPGFPGTTTIQYITFMTVNPSLNNGNVEVIIGLESDDGTTHWTRDYSYNVTTSASNFIHTAGDPSTPGYFGSPYPTWSRIVDKSDSPLTTVGSPCLAFPGSVLTDANTTSGHLFIYPSDGSNHVYPWGGTIPSPGTPTFSVVDLVTAGSEVSGQLIGHQGRLVTLSGIGYKWPVSNFNVNEQICYTDPPNSNAFGFQQLIVAPENPFGYGGMGSVNQGELFLIKKRGGGISILGDIFNAYITPYPGVQSTGDFYGKAGATKDGIIYCSDNAGAWLWNGGNSATKISLQLDDNFFDCTTGVINSNNYGYFVERWNDFVLFSNNYIYNTKTNSWWILYPESAQTGYAAGQTFFHYSIGQSEQTFYASPIKITQGGNLQWITEFDSQVPAQHYQWNSTPIHLNNDTFINMRRCVVEASCASGTGTVSIALSTTTPVGGVETVGPFTTGTLTTEPTEYLFNVNLSVAQDFTVTINSNNTEGGAPAPLVHSVSFGYDTRQHLPPQN